MLKLRTILYPTDFSADGDKSFELACALARDHGADLVVLHVYPPPVNHGEGMARQAPAGYFDELRKQLRRLQAHGPTPSVSHQLVEGEAAEEILHLAQQQKCDLIVLGTHGRKGLSRLLLGSVAEKVLREATCPVLTVKVPPAPKEGPEEGHPDRLDASAVRDHS